MADVDDLNSPGTRFQWFIVHNYGSVAKYIEQFDFNASQVYRTISNASSPRLETCQEYSTKTGINIQWMASGEGPWFAPNDVGRALAQKKGLVVADDQRETSPIDYGSIVHTIFSIAEPYVIERLTEQHKSKSANKTKQASKKSNMKKADT